MWGLPSGKRLVSDISLSSKMWLITILKMTRRSKEILTVQCRRTNAWLTVIHPSQSCPWGRQRHSTTAPGIWEMPSAVHQWLRAAVTGFGSCQHRPWLSLVQTQVCSRRAEVSGVHYSPSPTRQEENTNTHVRKVQEVSHFAKGTEDIPIVSSSPSCPASSTECWAPVPEPWCTGGCTALGPKAKEHVSTVGRTPILRGWQGVGLATCMSCVHFLCSPQLGASLLLPLTPNISRSWKARVIFRRWYI